jgi:hypothetical protein
VGNFGAGKRGEFACSHFRSTDQVAFADNADELAHIINDRKATYAIFQHSSSRVLDTIVR